VLFAFFYLLLRRVVLWIAESSNEQMTTEVELVVLRHQLMVLRRQAAEPRLRRRDRLFMAAISRVLPRARWSSFLVSPKTLLRWHRELVRRKWTYRRRSTGGRPPITDEVRELILLMGRENPRSGCIRIRGELRKLGIRVSATTIRALLRANGLGPAPRRGGPTWSEFLRSQARGTWRLTSSLRGDGLASDDVRALRGPHRIPSGAGPRRHPEPRLGVGHAASPQPSGRGTASRDPVRDPGP
jgi:hypothetical protein